METQLQPSVNQETGNSESSIKTSLRLLLGVNIFFSTLILIFFSNPIGMLISVIPVSSFAKILGKFGFPTQPNSWYGVSDAVIIAAPVCFLLFWFIGTLIIIFFKKPITGFIVGVFFPIFIISGLTISTFIVLNDYQYVKQNKSSFLEKYSKNILFSKCDTTYPLATTTVTFTRPYQNGDMFSYQANQATEKGDYCINIYIQCGPDKESCQRNEEKYTSISDAQNALKNKKKEMLTLDKTVITVFGNFSEKYNTQEERNSFSKKWWELNKDKESINFFKANIENGLAFRNGNITSSDNNFSSKLISDTEDTPYDKVYSLQFFDAGKTDETPNPYFSNYSTYNREYIDPYLSHAKLPSIYEPDFKKYQEEVPDLGFVTSRIYICPGNFSSIKTKRPIFNNCYYDTIRCTLYGCNSLAYSKDYYGVNSDDIVKNGNELLEEDKKKSLFLSGGGQQVTSFHGSITCDKNNKCTISRQVCKRKAGPNNAECTPYPDKIIFVKNEEELFSEMENLGLYFSEKFHF
jgi:hypothetical protein